MESLLTEVEGKSTQIFTAHDQSEKVFDTHRTNQERALVHTGPIKRDL